MLFSPFHSSLHCPRSNFTLQLMYITKSYLYLIELQVKKFVKFVFMQSLRRGLLNQMHFLSFKKFPATMVTMVTA